MNIVMVVSFGLQPKGTARVRALPLGEALVGRGHRVTLLVPPWDDPAASGEQFDQGGVQVIHMTLPSRRSFDMPLLTLRLLRQAFALRPDVLHTFKPKAYSGFVATAWWGLRRARREIAPLVMDTDDREGAGGWNDYAPYSRFQKRVFAWQEDWGLRHADAVTVASRTLESLVLSLGVPVERIAYVPNGPGARWQEPPGSEVEELKRHLGLEGKQVALLFTRFFEFDGAQLAQRWAEVARRLPGARLVVVGEGLHGAEQAFREGIARQQVEETVLEMGWQPFERLPAFFALAQVALYPMRDTLLNRAKCPVKLADYLQAGLPVVGEAVGQVAEYLAGKQGGVLVAPGDDEGFVKATIRLLQDREAAQQLGQSGRDRLRTGFDWTVQAERVERLYEAVVGKA